MNWFFQTLSASIGKKFMMAVTGLGFILFLAGHLAGNLTIYAGGDAFNAYADKLQGLGPVLRVMEGGLIAFALVHIVSGLYLFVKNRLARPVRYAVDKSAGGRTFSSVTMPYTGLLILAFVVFHLVNFTFVNKSEITIFQIVSVAFSNPYYVMIYILAMVVVALHVRHGFWSAFQTLGANHPKYMPAVTALSTALSLIVGFGFGLLPIYISLIA
jgi:succinate dehydrogenase / fumarate reductase cytochrome b subunit